MKYIPLLMLAILQIALNVVLLYKRHDKVSRTFTYFTLLLIAWTSINILLDYTTTNGGDLTVVNSLNTAGFMTASIVLMVLYKTVLVSQGVPTSRYMKYIFIAGGVLTLLTLSSAFSGSYYISNGTYTYHYGPASLLYVPYFAVLSWSAFSVMLHKLKTSQTNRDRQQTLVVLAALFISAAWAILFIIIIPLVLGKDSTIFIGYLSPYIFTMLMFYGIIWLGLLNFRQIIARSIGYLLSLMVLSAVFIVTIRIVVRFISQDALTNEQAVLFAGVSFVLAIIFQPAKKYFDRLTNRIFYRDAYDAELVFNKLSRVLVSAYDINALSQSVSQFLAEELKVSYAAIQLRGHETAAWPQLGLIEQNAALDKVFDYCAQALKTDGRVVQTELLDVNAKAGLKKLIQDQDVAVIVRLMPFSGHAGENLGYVVLGQKRSGNMYARQDVRVLESITNELLLAIQNTLHYEEIQNFNATLQQRVEDATRKLRVTNEKLKKLDETKDEFISMASHQLRTPLTSVKGYLSMVIEGDVGPLNAQQEELLKQSYMSSQRMVNLIADLLNLSRLNTGKFIIDATPTDLRVVVDQEIAGLRETARAKQIELNWNMPQTFSLLPLDENKIHQVVMNFIDNALYYTPEGGKVEVVLTETAKAVEFRVKDSGIGVPRELQRHLFTKFYRADNARRMRPDGTGLGLYMAKKVVVAQGGSVIFESKEGKGSTFGFRFRKELAPVTSIEAA